MSEATPSGRELEILKVLWDIGPASVREVHERMCPGGELAYNTVQTLLRIMDEKGLVAHRTRGRTFVYAARRSRDDEASRLLRRLFDGAVEQCVVSLLNAADSSAEELKRLEKLIADARRRKQAGQKGAQP
ncbi:MAG TPA: BlaI/MecI/CopY family transcriptional regulator [Pirellulales bacterium]|nr:BlaI/MecI/CopY family transcriptional regulator [Pirellulales bacterium]